MVDKALLDQAGNQCQLCPSTDGLGAYTVPYSPATSNAELLLCETCLGQISGNADVNKHHWRCLLDSMWSSEPAVQVMAWRQLKALDSEPWAQEALDILYLEDDVNAWANAGIKEQDEILIVKDCNGAILQAGDTVTVIKDLNVKGTSFVAKRGTAVRNINLTNNPEHIEGRVNGTKIVLLSCYVKKSS